MDTVSCALFPADCVLCGSPLPLLSSVPICETCWAEFPVHSGAVCPRCGDGLDLSDAASSSPNCRMCRLAPPGFVRAVSYGPYEGRMREAIHALKYDGLHPAAQRMGAMLARAIGELAAEAPEEMLVLAVPLHRTKFADRGFNQALALAMNAVKTLRRTHPGWKLSLGANAVVRDRATPSQASLTPRQRRRNVSGAFLIPDTRVVAKKNVLVVDDILTTGATARALSKALLQAGAASVWVATLARARRTYDYRGRLKGVYSARELERKEAGNGRAGISEGERPDRDRVAPSPHQPSF